MKSTLGGIRTGGTRSFFSNVDDRVRSLASGDDLVPKDPVEALDSLFTADDGNGDRGCRDDLLFGVRSSRTPASGLSVLPTSLSGRVDGGRTGPTSLGRVLASKSKVSEAFLPSSG